MTAEDFWNKVKARLSEQGKTFVWLCEQAGVSVQGMKNRIYKNIIPSVDDTLKLLSVLGVTVEDFYEVQNLFPAKEMPVPNLGEFSAEEKIPVYDQVFSCGYGQFVPATDVVDSYIAVPEELRGKGFPSALLPAEYA